MLFVGTPGEMITRSIWSSSHDGISPEKRPTLCDAFKDLAASVQSSTGFLSCNATTAPRSAKNLADSTPDFPAPRINVFLPTKSIFLPAKNWKDSFATFANFAGKTLYRNFNVDKLRSANSTATIKNLNTIFGSFQPVISKW